MLCIEGWQSNHENKCLIVGYCKPDGELYRKIRLPLDKLEQVFYYLDIANQVYMVLI
jgi:hypothetical protein